MKKDFILLILLALSLSACSGSDLTVTEKNAPAGMENNSEYNAIKRINEINNGATPKVKTESSNNSTKPIEPKQAPKTANTQELNINPSTKNMNTAVIKTNKGEIKIELDAENAPISTENFKKYASAGYYDGTIFHRVMPGFMIQGGGFDEKGSQKPAQAPIKNEAKNGLKNNRGTVAMARTMVVDSATSQFFINLVDNDFLNYQSEDNYGYAVFGKVTSGMDVVDEIAKVETGDNGPHQNWPVEDVVIESVALEE